MVTRTGCAIEAASGATIFVHFGKNTIEPLNMPNTAFNVCRRQVSSPELMIERGGKSDNAGYSDSPVLCVVHTAVDVERGTGDEAVVLAGEIHHCPRDVLGVAGPAQRNAGDDLLLRFRWGVNLVEA